MLRIALGLFHFNTQYIAGDIDFSDRYCREALAPFLETIASRAGWRVSVAMAGSTLEFVADRHPRSFALLSHLIEQGRIELISSLYAPSIWVAFPYRDLIRAAALNRRCLAALGLKDAGIFFAQEGFFGPGVSVLSDYFTYALCKDEYIDYLSIEPEVKPCYKAGNIRVIVGSNHLANLLASVYPADTLSEPHRRRLDSVPASIPQGKRRLERGTADGVEWLWYHMGSGNHFATPYSPEDSDRFFLDPVWLAMNAQLLDRIAAEGYTFGTIGEFAVALSAGDAPPIPPIVEGSWNTGKSLGTYVWMGGHVNPWEHDASILGLAWRAREELVQREAELNVGERDVISDGELETAWRHQLLAESSDPLGWAPEQGEVRFGLKASEQSLASASKLTTSRLRNIEEACVTAQSKTPPFTAVELFGGDGRYSVLVITETIQQIDMHLEQTSAECGIRFSRTGADVSYCPSALEHSPSQIRFEDFRPSVLYLPLTNGFITVGDGVSVIRVNRYGMTAARISREESFVTFGVEGGRRGTVHRWRFLLHRGPVDSAVEYANSINHV